MVEASAIWMDNERFTVKATSGHAVVVDAGAAKTANSPVELVLEGLCSCTASDVVTILSKKREPFRAVEVHAEAERADSPPKVYTRIKLVYRVRGKVSRKAVEDAVRLSEEKYCSVAAMLQKTARITYSVVLDEK
ncbi:MAG TPA: OsmC family protein [Terriglobales bacterium]|nr:OsmC family protein [Terriglobales bacterium]